MLEKKCIGLNGSAFYIQKLERIEDKLSLKVHIGHQTREKTIIGTAKLEIGQEVNLTRAFSEEESIYERNAFNLTK